MACKCEDCKNTEFVLKNKEKGRIELFHKHFWKEEDGVGTEPPFSEEPLANGDNSEKEFKTKLEDHGTHNDFAEDCFGNEIRLRKEAGSEMKFSVVSGSKKGIRKIKTEMRDGKKKEKGRKKTGVERSLFF
jgi:hypothetical protein